MAIGEVLNGLPTGSVDSSEPENVTRQYDAIGEGVKRIKAILTTCLAGSLPSAAQPVTPAKRFRKGKGGKPRLSKEEEQRRLEILSDWVQAQSADVAGKDFCRDKGIKLKELRAFVDWDSTRRKRGTNSG
jgi:hypothetical protein